MRPDHFRVVYLPRMGMLRETMGEIFDFFSYYWQSSSLAQTNTLDCFVI